MPGKMYVREDDAMGCEDCFKEYLDDGAVLPAHLHIHCEVDAGICGYCGYVLDPTIVGAAEEAAERVLDAVSVIRRVSIAEGERAIADERPQRPEWCGMAALSDDLREAAALVRKMAGALDSAGVDKPQLDL